jgi:hypothetical protein
MKNPILPILLFLLASCCQLHAQLPVKGNFSIGDTSQVHLLETKDGSRLVGRVIGFDQEKVVFRFNADTLVLPLSNLASIEVKSDSSAASTEPADSQEQPAATTDAGRLTAWSKGKSWRGTLKMGNDAGVRLQLSPESSRFFPWREIDSLVYVKPASRSEATSAVHVLTTLRGDRFTGYVKEYRRNILRFALEDGSILRFSTKDIRRLEPSENEQEDSAASAEPIPMQGHEKMYLTPTGFLLKEGETEFRTVVISNSIDHGVSDNFSIGGGFSTVIVATVLQGKAKVGTSLGKYVHVAAGGQLFGIAAIDQEFAGAAIAYGSLTMGTPESFVNINGGVGIGGPDGGKVRAFSLSASQRLGNNFRLFGEFLRGVDDFDEQIQFGIVGGSWFNREHRVDFGFVLGSLFDSGITVLPFPAVSYAYRF